MANAGWSQDSLESPLQITLLSLDPAYQLMNQYVTGNQIINVGC